MSSASNRPVVSVIINNYNYARFLRAAIDSALAQSYPNTEVIVVDDGSTDDSPAILASYGPRIHPVLQANGGQGAAFNAGFARSRGAYVVFLDADDLLHPDAVAQIVAAFSRAPQASRVQYRLAIVDAAGAATGATHPPSTVAIPQGDLQRATLLFGDDIPWLPTSGNAFAATVLRQILPMPTAPYRICADYYLSNLSPLYGTVVAVDAPLGSYRLHGSNHFQRRHLDLAQLEQLIARTATTHDCMRDHARRLGLIKPHEDPIAAHSLLFRANQLVAARAGDGPHRGKRFVLARQGLYAAWQRAELTLTMRLLYTAWFMLVALAPRRAVWWLAELLFFPETRGRWRELVGYRRTPHRARQEPSIDPS